MYGLLIWFVFLLLVALLSILVFTAVDSWFMPTKKCSGVIISKDYKPVYSTLVPVSTGKTTTMVPQYHPESYRLKIDIGIGIDSISVSKGFYNSADIGKEVDVLYCNGRISKSVYIKSIL